MCDYSLHAVATRPAEVGETIVTTTFRGTSTRGFASEADMSVAVCLLPGTELEGIDPHGFVLTKNGTEPIALTDSHGTWVEWLT